MSGRSWPLWRALHNGQERPACSVDHHAKRLTPDIEGIVASAIFQPNTSVREGMNNLIKVIKRMAYGYRDSAYFFLKVKDAFPGKAR